MYALLQAKTEETYERMLSELLKLESELNPTFIMVDFEKAAINALESNFLACVYGCFFHLTQTIYRRIQANGLATTYQHDRDFALKLRMLPCLAFVPEIDVIDCFNILMQEYPQSAMTVANILRTTTLENNSQMVLVGRHLFLSEYGTCIKE